MCLGMVASDGLGKVRGDGRVCYRPSELDYRLIRVKKVKTGSTGLVRSVI